MASRTILVAGSANEDMVMRVQRLPRAGETLMAHAFMTVHGGKGANQAVAAARLGARVEFAGSVGADAFGAMQREGLAREGIGLTHLRTHPELPTGVAQILIADTGDNMIVVAPGANHALDAGGIDDLRPSLEAADAVITQFEIPMETVAAVLRVARACGAFSILDVGAAIAVPPALLEAADLVTPNETEAAAITGIPVDSLASAKEAAVRLRDMGARQVVLKLGARGCLYLGDDELHLPAFPVQAVDTTAAGDAFTAALGVAWNHAPIPDALRFANAAGALAATVEGAQPSMPALSAVQAFLTAHDCALSPALFAAESFKD